MAVSTNLQGNYFAVSDRFVLKKCSSNMTKSSTITTKIICDPVHGQIALHPVCVAIIDTPEFQRLRHIKQTGLLDYIYPGATHNRFSHSLGVCFLAGKFAQDLRERQPELSITDVDILCVEIAGLCHDLGHGPFSHTWERFMNIASANKKINKIWKHEVVSANMIDYLIEVNKLSPILQNYGIGLRELSLIKDYIIGKKTDDPKKAFLHQIVNNDDSGLDVDKWDYFLRDCHYLGLPCNFEYERLIQCARVLLVDGKYQICFRDKVLECVYNVFRTRSNLHRMAYQHKVLILIERMFIDALILGDNNCLGPTGEIMQFWNWSMSAAHYQGVELQTALRNYCSLTDSIVFSNLKFSPLSTLQKASSLIQAIERRSLKESCLYKHIGLKILPHFISERDIHHGMSLLIPAATQIALCSNMNGENEKENINPENAIEVSPDDFCVSVISINWGKKEKNPVDSVHFYSKNYSLANTSENYNEVAALLPKSFEEIQARIISCRSDPFAVKVIRICFETFFNNILTNGSKHLHE